MIHLYTGSGKGKTTAAIGLCVRASGSGKPVLFTQFMKGRNSGELYGLTKLPDCEILRSTKEFGFYHSLTEDEKKELAEIHNNILDQIIQRLEEAKNLIVVLDEITYAVNWGLLDLEKLKKCLSYSCADAQKETEIILTGRDAPDLFTECADYITEMKNIRHPYEKGIPARKGIEY